MELTRWVNAACVKSGRVADRQ